VAEKADGRAKIDRLTGHLVSQGIPAERAQGIARDAAIRADRKSDGERAWRKPYTKE
jgi:hypothetical protein